MSALTLPRIFGPQLSSTKPVCIEKIAFLYIKIKMQHQRFPRRDLSVAFFRIQPKVFVGFKVVIFMNFAVLLGLLCLPACHCLNGKEEQNENHCDVLRKALESSSVSVMITKKGFHRQVETSVELSLGSPTGVQVMLLYRWPRGVYLQPYQIASLQEQSNWQILIDSSIDVELPAHHTQGFVTYVYPIPEGLTARIRVKIPIHGRYHEPSFEGKTFTSVHIEPPDLLLWSEKCPPFSSFKPHNVINAPCRPDNSSICSWVKGHSQQEPSSPVCLQFPVGDGLLLMPVCAGTLLVTLVCCLLLSKYMWKHRIS